MCAVRKLELKRFLLKKSVCLNMDDLSYPLEMDRGNWKSAGLVSKQNYSSPTSVLNLDIVIVTYQNCS